MSGIWCPRINFFVRFCLFFDLRLSVVLMAIWLVTSAAGRKTPKGEGELMLNTGVRTLFPNFPSNGREERNYICRGPFPLNKNYRDLILKNHIPFHLDLKYSWDARFSAKHFFAQHCVNFSCYLHSVFSGSYLCLNAIDSRLPK